MSDLETSTNEPIGSVNGRDVVSGKPIFPLEPHVHRKADIDPKAARRAERQVAAMFTLSTVFILTSIVAFIEIPNDLMITIKGLGTFNANHVGIGSSLGLGIFLIGTGAIHWAKKLMPDVEVTEERHNFASSREDRQAFAQTFNEGVNASGFGERKIIRRSLLGALAVFPLPLIVFLRDLGPMPKNRLRETIWKKDIGILTDATYRPLRPEDIPIGGLVNAVPENLLEIEEEDGNLNERGKASIILVRMD
ncbi:MAG: ubiquinol-cytochrome C reductase, partial [Actinobacteria bacterium]|nr:ubiquinol-cytochrome C reductase [Actinomycetota bacterium]